MATKRLRYVFSSDGVDRVMDEVHVHAAVSHELRTALARDGDNVSLKRAFRLLERRFTATLDRIKG